MNRALPRSEPTVQAPEGFRSALAELVGIGMSVARLVGRMAEAEVAAVEAAAQSVPFENRPIAGTLAEAIEEDRALAAVAEAQGAAVPRTETVVRAFARVSRSIRMTVLLAERLDRGWAQRGRADDREAMARRQVEHAVSEAIAADAGPDASRAERLGEALAERLERAEMEEDLADRPAEEIVDRICRDLGVNRLRQTVEPPELPDSEALRAAVAVAADEMPPGWTVQTEPWVGGMCARAEPWDRPPAPDG